MLELRHLMTEVNSVIKGLQQLSLNYDTARALLPSNNQKKLQTDVKKDLQTLIDLPDKIDVAITQRQLEKAVRLVEDG